MIMLMAAALALLSAGGQEVKFTGWIPPFEPFDTTLSTNQTSLNKVFVLYDTQGVGMTYTASSNEPVTWAIYDQNSWAHPEPVSVIHEGPVTRLPMVRGDKGYIITEGSTPHYYWVVDYSKHQMLLDSIYYIVEDPCDLLTLYIDGQADEIPYYEIQGARHVLDRKIKLTYTTLEVLDSTEWVPVENTDTFMALNQTIQIAPPLCNTVFKLSGDRFLKKWDREIIKYTDLFTTHSVKGFTTAVMEGDGITEPVSVSPDEPVVGSAPFHIVFTGIYTDAAKFRWWEMATDPEFETGTRDNADEVDYTFDEFGTYYVRYAVANDDGSCVDYSSTYTITVSESYLPNSKLLPNAFSPGTSIGVNDVWKVPYKSLVEFHCWIYNRWGTLVYEFTDPEVGWDGKYRGKYVDTGVYFFVITATGSDGVKYKRHGDINVLREGGERQTGTTDEQGGLDVGY